MAEYGERSISQLVGANRVRKRPAAVLGSEGLQGAQQGFWEIFGNGADEHSAGHGNEFDVIKHKDGSITFRDYGRGVPLGWNPDAKSYNWHLIYNEMYGGGKYDDNQEKLAQIVDWSTFNKEDYEYLYSVGLNGLGASATQYSSEFFKVRSVRVDKETGRKYKYGMDFKSGLPILNGEPVNLFTEEYDLSQYDLKTEETDEPTGTTIHWKPDGAIFKDTNIPAEWLMDTCVELPYITDITIKFEDEESGTKKVIPPGKFGDLLEVLNPNKLLRKDDDSLYNIMWHIFDHGKETRVTKEGTTQIATYWVAEADIAFAISKPNKESKSKCYHNLIRMKEGMHYHAITDAVGRFLRERAQAKGVSLQNSDYEGMFCFIISSFSNVCSFRNQTKDGVDDMFIYTFLNNAIRQRLELEYSKGTPEIIEAVDRVMEKANLRAQLKEAEKQLKKVNRAKRMKDPKKFYTCKEYMDKNYSRTELWIAEGDSAADSILKARDGAFQAVFCIRGKGLNLLRASISKLLDNREVMDIVSLLGTGIDLNIQGMKLFNIEDLRFTKIIFATDADVDGFHIRVLLFLIFYRLCPKLLENGNVFIAETPRYALVLNDGTFVYALDEKERDEKMKEYSGRFNSIKRYKGLGEVDADVLYETTVGVEHRRLVPVTCDFSNELEVDFIDALFGEDKKKQRKEILSMVLGESVSDEFAESMELLKSIDSEEIEEDVEVEVWE